MDYLTTIEGEAAQKIATNYKAGALIKMEFNGILMIFRVYRIYVDYQHTASDYSRNIKPCFPGEYVVELEMLDEQDLEKEEYKEKIKELEERIEVLEGNKNTPMRVTHTLYGMENRLYMESFSCGNCDAVVSEEDKFCRKCGQKLKEE